jgi:hypothetical protein
LREATLHCGACLVHSLLGQPGPAHTLKDGLETSRLLDEQVKPLRQTGYACVGIDGEQAAHPFAPFLKLPEQAAASDFHVQGRWIISGCFMQRSFASSGGLLIAPCHEMRPSES